MINFSKPTLILLLILLFSFSIRYYKLDSNPTGFFADEASMGVDALSILQTGKDRNGDPLPLFFKGFNFDNTSPYQVYLTVPFVALFGLNEKVVRLVPVFWSMIELLVFYLLLQELIPKSFALIGTFLLSISPWHFHISRINIGDYYSWTLLTLLGCLFLIKAFKNNKMTFYISSTFFFGLATYSYTPARLTTPLLFGLIILLVLIKKYFKTAGLMILFYTIILIPFIHFHITDPHGFQRIKDTMGTSPSYANLSRLAGSNGLEGYILITISSNRSVDIKNQKIINQPKKSFTERFFTKYLLHYSDTFLFQKGDADFPGQLIRRHSIAGLGLLYPYQKWLILSGLVWLLINLSHRKKYELFFVLFLLLLFPVADSLTNNGTPFATRSYLGVLPFHLLIGFGVYGIYQILLKTAFWKNIILKTFVLYVFSLLVFSSFVSLMVKFNQNPFTTSDSWGWQYGPREIMGYFLSQRNNYDELYMSGEFNGANIFLKFYDPNNLCQNKCKIAYFWRAPKIYNPLKRQLFSLSPEYLNNSKLKDKFLIKHTIYYPNGKEAFLIGEFYL